MARERMPLSRVAAALDINESTVHEWRKIGLPLEKRGGRWWADLDECREWVRVNRRMPTGDPRRADADLRKALALASLRELELAKRQGELISRSEVVEAVSSLALSLRRRLLGLPSYIAALCAGKPQADIERILGGEVHQLLRLASGAPYTDATCSSCGSAALQLTAGPPR